MKKRKFTRKQARRMLQGILNNMHYKLNQLIKNPELISKWKLGRIEDCVFCKVVDRTCEKGSIPRLRYNKEDQEFSACAICPLYIKVNTDIAPCYCSKDGVKNQLSKLNYTKDILDSAIFGLTLMTQRELTRNLRIARMYAIECRDLFRKRAIRNGYKVGRARKQGMD